MLAGEEFRDGVPGEARPARRAGARAERARAGVTRRPPWLTAVDACQRSLRQPVPVLLDLGLAGATVAAVSSSVAAGAVMAVLLLGFGMAFGVWKRRSAVQAQGGGWYLRRVLPGTALSAAALCAVPGLSGRQALVAGLVALGTLLGAKGALWVLVGAARRRGLGLSRTLVVGPERQVAAAEYRIHLYPEAGLVCAHSHVCLPERRGSPAESVALIERMLADHRIDHVVCTGGESDGGSLTRDLVRLVPPSVDVTVVQQVPLAGVPMTRLGDLAVICLARPSWGAGFAKRALDVMVASTLLVVLSPVLAFTALAIRLGDPGPVVFRQQRTGRMNRMFTIFKFRSMVENAESLKLQLADRNVADGLLFKAENDPRITRVGSVIRRFSIDELPQLVNVVRGEMSLVGPRPLPSRFDDSDLFARVRHAVLPGITGLWQVKGANALPYEDMIDLDCVYVATRSLGFDLKILLQTLPAVLVRREPY
jgi:exopolysaccharide biosynthesis polyprenyl glycosylphosphotransferase